jgi:hypothetical protein
VTEVQRSELARTLVRTANVVEEGIGRYLNKLHTRPGLEFNRTLMFAIALMTASAEQQELSHSDLRLVRDACSEAASACRARGLDAEMLSASLALQHVADLCDSAL